MDELQKMSVGKGGLGKVMVLTLAPNCDLMKSLVQVAHKENIRSGVILSGTGSLRQAVIRNVRTFPDQFPITDQNRIVSSMKEPLELLSFSGNISRKQDEVLVHCHISISSGLNNGTAYGGHLMDGCIVLATCEVIIAEITGLQMRRKLNPETQVFELNFDNREETRDQTDG